MEVELRWPFSFWKLNAVFNGATKKSFQKLLINPS